MLSFGISFADSQTPLIPADWIRSAQRRPVHFHDSPWIKKLNEAVRYELASVAIYRVLVSNRTDALAARVSDFADDHARATRKLATLIIAHRGIPADKPAPIMAGLNKSVLQICSLLPHDISESFCKMRLSAVERHLCTMYARLASEASEGSEGSQTDRSTLDELGRQAADRHFTLIGA